MIEPLKILFKGNLIPGFVVKVKTKTDIQIDNSPKVSIEEDVIPAIKSTTESLIEELKDN